MYTIWLGEDQEQADSVPAVEQVLDRLHERFGKGDPTLVTVERADSGDSLSIGLGADLSVLNYTRGDNDPPYYTSSGGSDADEPISFRFGNQWSEYSRRNAIPIAAARTAMTFFCETGELPKNVAWEQT